MMAVFGLAGITERRESFDLAAFLFAVDYKSEWRVVIGHLGWIRRDDIVLGESVVKASNLSCVTCFKYLVSHFQEIEDIDGCFVG